jgi:hypothetical protein
MVVLLSPAANAQFTLRGSISGIVTDPSNAVVPNIAVTLTDLDRNQVHRAETNSVGEYAFNNLTTGRYRVSIERPGFSKIVSDTVTLSSEQGVRVDMKLQLAQVAQAVDVMAQASLLQTEHTVVGQTIGQDIIQSLPMMGRNYTSVAQLSMGLSSFARSDSVDTWRTGVGGYNFMASGGGDVGLYLNGMNVNDNYSCGANFAPSVESISETKVDAANFSAASGRDLASIMVTTRGGTSKYRGTVF